MSFTTDEKLRQQLEESFSQILRDCVPHDMPALRIKDSEYLQGIFSVAVEYTPAALSGRVEDHSHSVIERLDDYFGEKPEGPFKDSRVEIEVQDTHVNFTFF